MKYRSAIVSIFVLFSFLGGSCQKSDDATSNTEVITPIPTDQYNPGIIDDYSTISAISNSGLWGSYNLHDPGIFKFNNEYFIFSTDVMYGGTARCGIMRRKSADLVKWNYKGWVFDKIPDNTNSYLTSLNYSTSSIWAPYVVNVNGELRLYYSISVFGKNISAIGLATSTSPYGPWTDKGIVISTNTASPVNAIDPTIVIDEKTGKHWMAYGSYWDGIYITELDAATGKPINSNSYGKKIAGRTQKGQAMEGPEIIYNPSLKKYFLFVSYDWLEDSYNVRVGRSDNPDGPYLDYFGNDMAAAGDNFPRITAQYKFNNHAGWQGFGHCGVLRDSNQYYYVSQARLASNKYLMDLHVHRIVWTNDGWPVISPERYVNVPQTAVSQTNIIGKWESLSLINTTNLNMSATVEFLANGTVSGLGATWTYTPDNLTLTLDADGSVVNLKVFREWDWENKKLTICYSGLLPSGISIWGKKLETK
jgi:arabinan endo-1,5-alpha-L-arabinosidase